MKDEMKEMDELLDAFHGAVERLNHAADWPHVQVTQVGLTAQYAFRRKAIVDFCGRLHDAIDVVSQARRLGNGKP